jgi:hypothetical protein
MDGLDHEQIKAMLVDDKLRPQIPDGSNPFLKMLITHCWRDNGNLRPTFEEIVNQIGQAKFTEKS